MPSVIYFSYQGSDWNKNAVIMIISTQRRSAAFEVECTA